MKIVIIGGTGFIGSYLAKILNDNGNYIAVIHQRPLGQDQKIKRIFYQRGFQKNGKKLLKDIETIIIATQPDPLTFSSILKFTAGLPKLKKIVYLSTAQLYEDSLRKQNETSVIAPLSSYEKAKFYEELALCQFARAQKIALCVARLSNVYGDVKNKGIVNLLVCQLLHKTNLAVNGDGNQKKDFIFIEDAADLISRLAVVKQKTGCKIFNISSGESYSVNEIISFLEHISNKKIIFKYAPLPNPEKKNSAVSNTKILSTLNYRLRYPIIEGLKKTLNNYEQHLQK